MKNNLSGRMTVQVIDNRELPTHVHLSYVISGDGSVGIFIHSIDDQHPSWFHDSYMDDIVSKAQTAAEKELNKEIQGAIDDAWRSAESSKDAPALP
jgi:hypothetical protein